MDEQKIRLFLKELESTYKIIMRKIDLDSSELVKNTQFLWINDEVVIRMYDYAINVDKGRRSNATPPPIKDILSWIKEKGITSQLPIEQLAFASSNMIGKKGIKPRQFLENLQEEVTRLTALFIQKQIETELLKQLNKQ